MIVIIPVLLIGLIAAGIVLMLALRKWTFAEARTEIRLHSPDTPTVAYDVPSGHDPAAVMAALAREGIVSVPEVHGGVERLIVACDAAERPQVRAIIERVERTGYEGEPRVEHVRFDDEAEPTPS